MILGTCSLTELHTDADGARKCLRIPAALEQVNVTGYQDLSTLATTVQSLVIDNYACNSRHMVPELNLGKFVQLAFGGDRLDGLSVREVAGGGQHAQLGGGGDWLLLLHAHAQAATLPGVHVPLQQQPEAEDDSRRQLLLPLVLLLRGEV